MSCLSASLIAWSQPHRCDSKVLLGVPQQVADTLLQIERLVFGGELSRTEGWVLSAKKLADMHLWTQARYYLCELERSGGVLNLCVKDTLACKVFLSTAIRTFWMTGEISRVYEWLTWFVELFPYVERDTSFCIWMVAVAGALERWQEAYRWCCECYDSVVCTDLFFRKKEKMRWKLKRRAQTWALWVPGGGHFYSGAPLEGVWSGLLQVGSAALGIYLLSKGLFFTSVMVGGTLFMTFRSGSVFRAQHLAEVYNTRLLRRIVVQLGATEQTSLPSLKKNPTTR